jgi:type IV secretory pathway VirB2 component (pilin)
LFFKVLKFLLNQLAMKKISILFSFLLLFLVVVSSDSFAQTSGTCSGNPINACGSIPVSTLCADVDGCSGVAGACTGTITCESLKAGSQCKAVPGCIFTVTANGDDNAFVDTLCNALKIITGSGGKAFAAFAIISIGIGFFTGKISWGLLIGVTAGIAAMFGAPTIVAAISGGSAVDCSA